MDKQRLSIAMCTYNGAKYLQEQLDSIAAQTRLPDELVVCDDRSSDSTREIIKSFGSNVSFPVHLHLNEENLGVIKNFEKAISLCTGDIIALSDQDDFWNPNKIEKILTAFAENLGAGYIFSNAEFVNESLSPLGSTLWQSIGFEGRLLKEYREGEQVKVLLKRNMVCGATLAFRSSLKNLVLPIPPVAFLLHDAWIALVASSVGFYGIPLSDSLIYYRQHALQAVGGKATFLKRLKIAQNSKDAELYKMYEQGLLELKNRLLLRQSTFSKDITKEVNLIQQKAEHFSRRAFLRSSSNFPLKVKGVVSEILTGKYHRFSNSWQSVAKDLWF
jgi:glycosyltransferase involved in cell wall biosynthesis